MGLLLILSAREPASFAAMTFTRGEPEQNRPNPGDFAWGWISAAFVLAFCALVWGVVGEFLY